MEGLKTKAGVPITSPRLVELSFLCSQEKQSLRVPRRRAKKMPTALPWQQRRAIYLATSGREETFEAAIARCEREIEAYRSQPDGDTKMAIVTTMGIEDWEWEKRLIMGAKPPRVGTAGVRT